MLSLCHASLPATHLYHPIPGHLLLPKVKLHRLNSNSHSLTHPLPLSCSWSEPAPPRTTLCSLPRGGPSCREHLLCWQAWRTLTHNPCCAFLWLQYPFQEFHSSKCGHGNLTWSLAPPCKSLGPQAWWLGQCPDLLGFGVFPPTTHTWQRIYRYVVIP